MLFLLLAAVILIPLFLVLLGNASFKSKSKAAGCEPISEKCVGVDASQCFGKGESIENGMYTCIGNSEWQNNSNGQKVVGYPSASANKEVQFEVDEKQGCTLALGFLGSNQEIDLALKNEAEKKIVELKSMWETGTKCDELLSLIRIGKTQTQMNEIKELAAKDSVTADKLFAEPNSYEKFLSGISANMAFSGSAERHMNFGEYFYQDNPDFRQKLSVLETGKSTDPFLLYASGAVGKREYAWMIIMREK